MKVLKIKFAAFGLLLVMAASVFLTSCEQNSLDTVTDYSGKEYFRAIFLMEGDLASQIPSFDYFIEHKNNQLAENPERAAEIQHANNMLESAVEQVAPYFFEELKAAILSNDAGKIEAILNKGNDIVRLASIQNMNSIDPAIAQELEKLDIEKYDFTKQEDIEAYLKDAEVILAPTNLGGDYVEGRIGWAIGPFYVGVAIAAVAIYVVLWYTLDWDAGTGVFDAMGDENYVNEKLVTEIANLNPHR